jgi:hypothetical protein
MRLPVWDKPRVISCSEETSQYLCIPRGCLPGAVELLKQHGVRVAIRDERYAGTPIDVTFRGILRGDQEQAIQEVLRHDDGVLCAPTAFGKTVVAARLIAERKVNALVLVHRQSLLEQWRELRRCTSKGLFVRSIRLRKVTRHFGPFGAGIRAGAGVRRRGETHQSDA